MNNLIHQIYATALDANQWPELILSLSTNNEESPPDVDSHINQAIELKEKHQVMEDKKDLVTTSLSLLPVALFAFVENNQQHCVEAINTKAESLLPELQKDLLKFCSNKLLSESEESDHVFSEHIIYDERSYFFLLLKLDPSRVAKGNPVILVSLSNQYLFNDSELFELWNFSPKETAICKLLLEGESIQSISLKNSRSIHTIRSQVKAIFQKSGCNSQISLIRRFYNSPLSIQALDSNESESSSNELVTRKMTLKDGRTLAWSEQGDPNGTPVLMCHSMHQSRLLRHPDESFTVDQKIRMITPDRPGYGASDKNKTSAIIHWSEDVKELLTHLKIDSISLVGLGLGTHFALLVAEALDERIKRTICVGLSHFIKPAIGCNFPSSVAQAACLLTKISPKLVLKVFKLMGRDMFLKEPASIISSFYRYPSSNDQKAFNNKRFQQLFIKDFSECNRQGFGEATVNELHYLLNQKRVISPESIKTPVECWYAKNCENPNQQEIESLVKELPEGVSQCIDTEDAFIIYHEWQNYIYRAAFGKTRPE